MWRIWLFTFLFGKGREIWIWNWIWVKFGLNWKVFEAFFINCLGTPCYLIVVSGGFFFLNRDTRRCFLQCLQVSSSSSLLIEFWSGLSISKNIKVWFKSAHFLPIFVHPKSLVSKRDPFLQIWQVSALAPIKSGQKSPTFVKSGKSSHFLILIIDYLYLVQ